MPFRNVCYTVTGSNWLLCRLWRVNMKTVPHTSGELYYTLHPYGKEVRPLTHIGLTSLQKGVPYLDCALF